MWDAVRALRAEDITVVLTTHYMEEADELCDRVAIIDHGKILVEDTPAALKASVGGDKLYDLRLALSADRDRLAQQLRELTGVTGVELIESGLRVLAQTREGLLPQVITAANTYGLRDVTTAEPTLETVFIRLTGRDLRE
jgi:ABC-2 type transport system ATP-binding protein